MTSVTFEEISILVVAGDGVILITVVGVRQSLCVTYGLAAHILAIFDVMMHVRTCTCDHTAQSILLHHSPYS